MRIKLFLFILPLTFLLFSCKNQNSNDAINVKDTDSILVKNESHNDGITKIPLPSKDSIADFCDSVIGRFHIRHFTRNDSTRKFVPGHLQRFVTGIEDKIDSTNLPYARKACLYVCDKNKVYQKEITIDELQRKIKVDDIEYFLLYIGTTKLTNDSNLLFTVSLSMDDTYYVFEFDYEYHDGKFTLKKCRMYDEEGEEEINV